jgi:sRNA-binding carbon storage regulator CsrA
MLVLSRNQGQKIVTIDLVITILEVSGSRVKLGFEGPGKVLRENARLRERVVEAEVAGRLAAQEKLCDVEMDLDRRENLQS